MEALPLPLVDALDAELARLEGPVAGRDDDHARLDPPARRASSAESTSSPFWPRRVEVSHLLAEHDVGAELEALLGAEVDERLPLDLRVAGHVEDVLLGIDGRDLAAELLEALDDADASPPGARRSRTAASPTGPAADDRDVVDPYRSSRERC